MAISVLTIPPLSLILGITDGSYGWPLIHPQKGRLLILYFYAKRLVIYFPVHTFPGSCLYTNSNDEQFYSSSVATI